MAIFNSKLLVYQRVHMCLSENGAKTPETRNFQSGRFDKRYKTDLEVAHIFPEPHVPWPKHRYNDIWEIMVSKGNHPQMALIQVSEIL